MLHQVQFMEMIKSTHSKKNIKLNQKIFAVWGLSFKPETDDIREAPSINMITSLIEAGAVVQAFDPVVKSDVIKEFPKDWIEDKKIIFYDNNYQALENAHALVLMTEWKMFRSPNIAKMKQLMQNLCIFDGRNQYDPEQMQKLWLEKEYLGN